MSVEPMTIGEVIRVPCSRCGAAEGKHCTNLDGKPRQKPCNPHAVRWNAAKAARRAKK